MHKSIIGRTEELKRLTRCVESDEAQLIGIYGRRRVGKTYLVDYFFNGRYDFKITGIFSAATNQQLENFITELNIQWGKSLDTPPNWMSAFGLLRQYLESNSSAEKKVVFFDEIPWLDTNKSDFMTAFEWFWNGWGNMRDDLIFVISGSATSWMRENIDDNKGGFYRRLTCRIYLNPFTLKEVEEYLISRNINWSRYDITHLYMIMGGIPYYLQLLDPEMSLNRNIDNIFFRKRAELWDEFTFLYRVLFPNSQAYIKVVEALCTKRSGLCRSEISKLSGLPANGALTEILSNLEYSGFIRINDFYGNKKKKIYQISDYYTMFYYKFIKDNYGKDEHYWSHTSENPAKRIWLGLTFEQVCKDHFSQIKKALGISGVLTEQSVWNHKGDDDDPGAQIDILISRNDRVINLCEVKFSGSEYVIDKEYDEDLRNKIETFSRVTGIRDTLQLTMITTFGVKKGKYSNTVTNQVILDDLFES